MGSPAVVCAVALLVAGMTAAGGEPDSRPGSACTAVQT